MRIALVALVMIFATAGCTTTSSGIGGADKVHYSDDHFHVEIAVVKNDLLGQKILRNEENPIMALKLADRRARGNRGLYKVSIPESRHYDIWTALERQDLAFAERACTFDVEIIGIDPKRVGETRILKRGMYLAGTTTPAVTGQDSIIYRNLSIREVGTLVLPMEKGVWGGRPMLKLNAKNCAVRNPGATGSSLAFYMGHRTAPNGHEMRPNKAILVSVLTD